MKIYSLKKDSPEKAFIIALNYLVLERENGLKAGELFTWVEKYSELYNDNPFTPKSCDIHLKFMKTYEVIEKLIRIYSHTNEVRVAFNDDRFIDLEPDRDEVLKWLIKYSGLYDEMNNVKVEESLFVDFDNSIISINELFNVHLNYLDFRDLMLFLDKFEYVFNLHVTTLNGEAPEEAVKEKSLLGTVEMMKSKISARKFLCLLPGPCSN